MQKYIVKNCPAFYNESKCLYDACITPDAYNNFDNIEYMDKCEDIDNCLIKQVIEKLTPKALIGGLDETIDEVFEMFEIE